MGANKNNKIGINNVVVQYMIFSILFIIQIAPAEFNIQSNSIFMRPTDFACWA